MAKPPVKGRWAGLTAKIAQADTGKPVTPFTGPSGDIRPKMRDAADKPGVSAKMKATAAGKRVK